MQVHYGTDNLPGFNKTVVTIGTFDGVHLGHQKIIDTLQSEANKISGETVVITFHPHPRKIVHPETSLELINSLEEKIGLLSKKEIDHLVIVPFTETFSKMTADEYIRDFLVRHFNPHIVIIGYDHHFGKNREGNFHFLEERSTKYRYKVLEVPKHVIDEIAISSTQIREAILESKIEKANTLLGYSFFFSGKVIEGDKLGRQLGYPTANIEYSDTDKIRLGEGVFVVTVQTKNEQFGGMLSIGKRPTLNDNVERVEVNIFNFDRMIYGETIIVSALNYLRAQEKYDTLDELVNQLHRDKENSLRILNP